MFVHLAESPPWNQRPLFVLKINWDNNEKAVWIRRCPEMIWRLLPVRMCGWTVTHTHTGVCSECRDTPAGSALRMRPAQVFDLSYIPVRLTHRLVVSLQVQLCCSVQDSFTALTVTQAPPAPLRSVFASGQYNSTVWLPAGNWVESVWRHAHTETDKLWNWHFSWCARNLISLCPHCLSCCFQNSPRGVYI